MAHSKTVTFEKGATSHDVPGPIGPTDDELTPEWVTDRTADGTRISYRVRDQIVEVWTLQFQDLELDDKKNLYSFFRTEAKGPTNTFTYTHTNGQDYTATWIDTGLRFRRANNNKWMVTIRLELTAEIQH